MPSSPNNVLGFVCLFILILLSGFFSCSETALLSVNKIRMRSLMEEGNKKAKLVLKLLDKTDSLLSTILVGNNVVNIGASSLSTILAMDYFGSAGAGIATGALTLVILIFGEITPKSIATKYADKISLIIVKPINFLVIILTPIVFILNLITGLIAALFGVNKSDAPRMTEEELKTYVNVSHEEGVIEEEEKEMIHNVFEFGDTEIKEIMTPRIHVISISETATYDEIIEIYKEQRFSRIPVHSEENYDEILGTLNIKDLLLIDDKEPFELKKYLREPFVVYEFNRLDEVFAKMRDNKISSLAIVVDEYGVMSGIVTIEDIIEEIVGDIEDEYDEEDETIRKIGENSYLVDGTLGFNEINDELDTHFDSDDFESIGGMVLGEIGELELHREIKIGNALLSIEKAEKNRVELVKLVIIEDEKIEDD